MNDLSILFEDGEALVIDKPAGLPLDRPRAGGISLDDFLPTLRLGFAREPAAVHRLDRDTSGCLLLARNPKALKRFSAAFEQRLVAKVYLGIVAGKVEGDHGVIDLAMTKISSAADGWRMILAKKGKPALTRWRKLAENENGTLVEFRPETGRTHQIRVHALHGLGNALLGDPVYGERTSSGPAAARTMLHASRITITRAGKPPVDAHAPMPADFVALGFEEVIPTPWQPAPEAEETPDNAE
jgi:tRNA pseudouridine32 synthase / 23S rRNA pseudouridine746 synthase